MPEDWKHLNDADLLTSFLQDADDLREDFDDLAEAFAAEGGAMQGTVRTYLAKVVTEIDRAPEVGTLRVGKLLG